MRTGLEEQKQKLLATFKELSTRYEANAKQDIANGVNSVKANERSAEEICRTFATGLLKHFEKVLPGESKGSAMPSALSARR